MKIFRKSVPLSSRPMWSDMLWFKKSRCIAVFSSVWSSQIFPCQTLMH